MKYGLSDQHLKNIVAVLSDHPGVDGVILYGSRAKGNFKNHSDIDLTLIGDSLNLAQLSVIMTKLDDLLLPYQFDVSLYRQIDNQSLLDHIERVGIPLL